MPDCLIESRLTRLQTLAARPPRTKKAIAFFLPCLAGGGAERAVITLAAGVAGEGIRTDLVLASARGPFREEVCPAVRIVDLHASRTARALLPLARYLRRERPRLLVTTLDHASVLGLLSAFISRSATRVVVREANVFSLEVQGPLKWIAPLLYRRARGFIAVSAGVADDLKTSLSVPAGKIRVIYNPVVSPQFVSMSRADLSHPWFAPGQPPVLLAAGRLAPQKDYPTLLRAFAIARRAHFLRLMILGEGAERRRLEALAGELGLGADFSLPGFVPNPFPYMRLARVFVLSSAWEGLPNVLIQAIALGRPVVTTDCRSGPREICDGVASAVVVPVGDAGAMAAGIGKALAMPAPAETPSSLKRFELRTAVSEFLRFSENLA